ncbi:uncharacterized protein LOC126316966 [Schistocerca gregaria]|uniref:uncharacterized protein LOC126316966 n=1 Tax=Schistocerca gregaria TaxID=7010 RepID=UPI00211E0367|nr:uncharacterized protein LOC126316966 [Schistocerca gregaria]
MCYARGSKMDPSLEIRHVNAVNVIKLGERHGKTIEELKRVMGSKYGPDLHEALLRNDSLEFIESEQKFVFKSKVMLASREDLERRLAEGPVVINGEDVKASYDALVDDIEEMRLAQKIVVISSNRPSKDALRGGRARGRGEGCEVGSEGRSVLYKNPFEDIDPGSFARDEEIVQWYHTVKPAPAYSDVEAVLRSANIGSMKLDCDAPPETQPPFKKKKMSTRCNGSRRIKSRGLMDVAAEVRAFMDSGIDISKAVIEEKVSEEQVDKEEAERLKKRYLYYDKEANPKEYEMVRQAVFWICRLFYDNLTMLVLALFLEQKIYKEPDLVSLLSLSREQVNKALVRLEWHQLLNRSSTELRGSGSEDGKGLKKSSIWLIDLNRFFDFINYRLVMYKKSLRDHITKLKMQVLRCGRCDVIYEQLEIGMLEQMSDFTYHCNNCRSALEHVDNQEVIRSKEDLMRRCEELFRPLNVLLAHLGRREVGPEPDASQASSFSQMKRKSRAQQGGGAGRAGEGVQEVGEGAHHGGAHFAMGRHARFRMSAGGRLGQALDRVKSSAARSEQRAQSAASTSASEERRAQQQEKRRAMLEQAKSVEFNATPVSFGRHGRVLIPIIEEVELWEREHACQLAKYILDNIAEFEKMKDNCYVYRLTRHSLFVGFKRGIRPVEVARILSTLSSEPIPAYLFCLIMNREAYTSLYQAHIKLKSGKYLVETKSLAAMKKLQSLQRVAELVPNPGCYAEEASPGGTKSYWFEIGEKPLSLETIRKEAFQHGVPIIDEYNFFENSGADEGNEMRVSLKSAVSIRDYQLISCSKLFWDSYKVHSGVLVLPCGAGKTLIGVVCFAILQKPCIVFCQSSLAVTQWKEMMSKWTTIESSFRGHAISRFTASNRQEWSSEAPVIITTYAMFSNTFNRQEKVRRIMDRIFKREWGLMILDEVHQAPATVFREVTNGFKCHVKLGLTATLVREDEKLQDLVYLVGPKLYELDIFTLKLRGHLAPVKCFEIRCPFTDYFRSIYEHSCDQTHSKEQRKLLFVTNINKTRVCMTLIRQHLTEKRKIMIFCDDLFGLEWYHELLRKDKIDGATPEFQRETILKRFRSTDGGDCVLFSKVGDMSIDLPEAEVIIQIAVIVGSRMQEGQRIGRVQRPQPQKKCAYFYSLVTKSTEEERYAENRRKYLIDHGYSVRVEDDITPYLTEDTEKFYLCQERLIDAVRVELNKRESMSKTKKKVLT